MFAYDQTFDISCSHRDLAEAIRFAIMLSGSEGKSLGWKIMPNGLYAIGCGDISVEKGWIEYERGTSPEDISDIITDWAEKAYPCEKREQPGGTRIPAIRIKNARTFWKHEGHSNKRCMDSLGNEAIAVFSPTTLYYEK